MDEVNLSQFASLFEIGFALHFAVAFLERIYARDLPLRLDSIAARAKALEQLQKEIGGEYPAVDHPAALHQATLPELRLAYRSIQSPVWTKHNDYVLDRVYALWQDSKGQMRALKRILNVITFLSILVVIYSVAVLFLIGLNVDAVTGLDPMTASVIVLLQLLPLPVAAGIFFLVARRMSHEIDRKIRGVGELQLILSSPEAKTTKEYASVDQIYQRSRQKDGLAVDS